MMKAFISSVWTGERKEWAKRKVAALLCTILVIQAVLPAQLTFGATVPEAGVDNVIELQGNPDEAFTYIRAKVGDKVGSGGDSLSLYFYFEMDDDYRDEKLSEYIENGTLLDVYDFEQNDAYREVYEQFGGSYDNYLLAQHGLENPEFTCTVNEGLLDVAKIREYLEDNDQIVTTRGDNIGTWELENTADGPQFRIVLNNIIYNRSNIIANKGVQLSLLESFEPGTDVDAQPGSGNVDIEITINGEGTPTATDSNYEMDKFADISDEDPSAIIYTVMAYASSSNADPSIGTDSNASSATGANALSAYTYEDEDNEDIEADSRDMDLIYDLEAPTQSHIVRTRAAVAGGTVVASDSNLIGKYISDTISDGLVLGTVEISYDGYSWNELSLSELGDYENWEAYLEDNGRTFFYQIVGEDGETDTEDAVVQVFGVRFHTRLSEAGWKEYAGKGELHKVFPNRAVLKDEDQVTTLTASNKVEPRLDWSTMLEKEGLPLDVSGKVYQWNINTDTKFTDGVQLYAVDSLKDIDNTHMYIWEDPDYPITITRNGQTETLEVVKLTEEDLEAAGAENIDFENITINDIETILSDRYLDGKAYIYEYEYQEEQNGAQETKRAAVMLVPLDQYANGESQITYYTDITRAKETGLNYSTSIKNEVKAVWKWNAGEGPGTGEEPFGGLTIWKTFEIDVKPVGKEGVHYDEMNNLITWEFEVNRPGVTLNELWIEDVLNLDESSWAGAVASGSDLILTGYERRMANEPGAKGVLTEPSGKELVVAYEPDAAENPQEYATENYYTVTEQDGKQTLTMHLYEIGADDYYKFQVQTYVENRNYVQATLTVKNTAEYWGTSGDQEIRRNEVSAQQTIKHTLIAKSKEPFVDAATGEKYLYNYDDNTVQWKVRINEKGLPIANAVITDELPLGVSFPYLETLKNNTVTGAVCVNGASSQSGTWTPGTDAANAGTITFADGTRIEVAVAESTASAENGKPYSKDTVTFAFKNADGSGTTIKSKYEITFITQLDEDFRREVVKSNKVTSLLNRASLDGTIDGKPVQTGWVTAENEAVPKPLVKEGTYHGRNGAGKYEKYDYKYYDENDVLQKQTVEAAYFNWTAYVNRTGADMLDVKISDTVADIFELVDASLNIDVIQLDASGSPIPGTEKRIVENRKPYDGAVELKDLSADESGFSFTIPEEYKNSVLKLTFDTVLVDDAVASEMTNQITAEGADWKDSSEEATDSKADDFRIEDYAQAEGMFFLRVVKSSATTDALALKGAKFELTRMEPISQTADRSDIANWVETSTVKTKTTNARGVLNFMFLRQNAMYKLVETVPPVGYDKVATQWYMIIRPAEGTIFPEEHTTTVSGTPAEILIEQNKNYINTGIKNAPNGKQVTSNNLKLKKLGQNSQLLAGVEFGLYLDNRRLKSGVTGADGTLMIEDLDPLKEGRYYLLKEITPEGYETAEPIRVYVTAERQADGSDTYEMKLTRMDGMEIKLEDDYLIENKAIRQNGSFRKVDQNGDLVTGLDVTFDVSRRGDGGSGNGSEGYTVVMAPEGDNADQYVRYNVTSEVSTKKGIVELNQFYYGYYKLTERLDGEKLLSEAAPVYIHVNEQGMYALPAGEYSDEEVISLDDSAYSVNLNSAANLTVENNLKWGLVQVNKVVGKYALDASGKLVETAETDKDGDPIPVSGAVFAVYRVKDDKREATPMMHIKTDKKGQFIMLNQDKGQYQSFDKDGSAVKDGNQTTGKVLPVGSYSLKEVKVVGGSYEIRNDFYPFNIVAGQGTGSGYVPAGAAVVSTDRAAGLFLNMPVRHGVNFKKVDANHPKLLELKNAEFHVYDSRNQVVAELRYNSTSKGYVLQPNSADAVNKDGIPYLSQSKDGKSYELLTGTYKVKETKAPELIGKDGNAIPDVYPTLDGREAVADLIITAKEAKLQSVAGSVIVNNGQTFQNRSKRGSFNLRKRVQELIGTQNQSAGQYEYHQMQGFEFTLTSTELMYGALNGKKVVTRKVNTDKEGLISFADLPIGTYHLEETNVPSRYKLDGKQWLVHKVPDTYVKVDAAKGKDAAVTFYSDAECTQKLDKKPKNDKEIPDGASNIYDSTGNISNGNWTAAYNSLKLANVTGTKQAVFGEKQTPLAGAELTLTHKTLGYTFKSTTDAAGNIKFEKIPYGTYTLVETNVPEGYKKIDDLTFTVRDDEYQITSGEAGTDGALKDEAVTVDAKFKKVDQNGEVIPNTTMGTQFKVTQTKSGIAEALGGPFTGETNPAEKTFSVDTLGILNITGLTYGTYDVQELETSVAGKLDDQSNLAHFIITVEKGTDLSGGAAGTKVTVKNYVEGNAVTKFFKSTFNSDDDSRYIDQVPQGDIADFSDMDANAPLMTNILNYGFVAIKKVRGEQTSTGVYTASDSPIEGAIFEIHKVVNGTADRELYLTLKTDKNGSFPEPDKDGKYQDAKNPDVHKALVAGDYVLRETGIDGTDAYKIQYEQDEIRVPEIAFEITDKGDTVWFYTDRMNRLIKQSVETGRDLKDASFMNIPKRGTLHFTKVDADTGAALEGAVFGVYDGDKLVAFAEYHGASNPNKAEYRIVTAERAAQLAASNKDWNLVTEKADKSGAIPYSSDRDGIGYLLAGSYTLKELQTPTGDYKLLNETIPVAITDGGDIAVNSSGADNGIVKNDIQKTAAALTFKKQVIENPYRPNTDDSSLGNGFHFVLKGTPSNSYDAWMEKTFTSAEDGDENGVFRIGDIPVGTYALYEQKPSEDAYQGFDGKTEAKLLDIVVSAGTAGEPEVKITPAGTASQTEPEGIRVEVTGGEGDASIITGAGITNNWKTGTIKGYKVARAVNGDEKDDVRLEGIYFALYASEQAETPIAVGTSDEAAKYLAVTDANGEFRFENVPYGTYWVGEYGTAEGQVPEGYAKNDTRQQITVSRHGEEVTVSEEFVNERLRGTAVLDKVSAMDKTGEGSAVKLSGAEFTVYTNEGTTAAPVLGKKVAFLTEADGEPGHYVVNNTNGAGEILNEKVGLGKVGAGLPYLELELDRAAQTRTFWLAYGEYVVIETKTPAGYQPDVQSFNSLSLIPGTPGASFLKMHPLTISGEQGQNQIWYMGNDTTDHDTASLKPQTFANTRTLADLEIAKQAELPTYNGMTPNFEAGAGFRFRISGIVDDPGDLGSAEGLDLMAYLERSGRTDLDSLIETDLVTGERSLVLTTDENGTAGLSKLPAGTYTVEELVEDSEDYRYQPVHDDSAKRQVKITFSFNTVTGAFEPDYEWTWTQDGTKTTSGSASEKTFKNRLKRGSIQGRKVAADNEAVGLAGAVFGLYTDENCTDDSKVMTATSSNAANPSGGFTFEQVPYGTYYMKEIAAPSGYVPSTMQYKAVITAQGAYLTQGYADGAAGLTDIVFTNSNKRGDVQLTKRSDDGTGTAELMADLAEFTVFADETCTETEAVAYLKDGNKDGVYTLEGDGSLKQTVNGVRYLQADGDGALKLIQGTYWLKETKTPDGYEAEMDGAAQRTYQFTIYSNDSETVQDLGTAIISNSGNEADTAFYNRLALGGFTLEKTVEISKTDDLAMSDDKKPGEGFVFEIAGRDTVAGSLKQIADITTLRINGEAVETEAITAEGAVRVTTDGNGKVQISGLPIGSYTVNEVDGPDYDLYTGTEPRTVTLTQNSDKTELLTKYDGAEADPAADSLSFHNSLKRYSVAGQKVDDRGMVLAGAEFGLYSEDKTVQYRTAVSGENGRFVFAGLPTGDYVVKEIKAPSAAYAMDDTEYRVEVRSYMDPAVEILVGSKPIVNTLKRGNIEGMKLTNRNTPLAGAVIGLFAEGTTEFVEANLYDGRTAVSGEDGSFVFRDIPYGTYRVAEVTAPSGYGLNKMTTFVVGITQAGETVNIGYLAVPNRDPADAKTEIVIINSRNTGGGGGGGGSSTPTGPSNPGGPGGGLPIPNQNEDMLVTINDNNVPLGSFLIPIEDEEVPLALPKTGNSGLPAALQAVALFGSIVGAMILRRRKKDDGTP